MNMNAPDGAPTGEVLERLRKAAHQDARDLRAKISELDEAAIELILTGARSHYAWTDKPIGDDVVQRLYDIVKMGPTSMNGCPARFIFVKSPEGKERVAKSLKPANVPKMKGAPLTVIVAYDSEFWRELPRLFPHDDRRHFFEGKLEYSEETAFRNSTLQGGYLMIAARALGLDVGAMSGFSNKVIDEEFFQRTSVKSNFLCNIGYADESALFQRLPRFDFNDVCEIV